MPLLFREALCTFSPAVRRGGGDRGPVSSSQASAPNPGRHQRPTLMAAALKPNHLGRPQGSPRPGGGRGGENPANLTAGWEPRVPQIRGHKPNSQTSRLKQGLFCRLNFPATGTVFNPATEYNQRHLECSDGCQLFPIQCPSLSTVPRNYGEFRVGMFYDASFQAHDKAEGRVI